MTSRRLSLGGSSLLRDKQNTVRSGNSHRSETPMKDRRAMLDEWRRQSRTRDHASMQSSDQAPPSAEEHPSLPSKKPRQESQPPLPPSSGISMEGTTALERFRMRRALREQQEASICVVDGEDHMSASTPLQRVRARRKSMATTMSERSLVATSVNEVDVHVHPSQGALSQLTMDTGILKDTVGDTVEDAGLKSQLREMQGRVDQLEKEKMVLSMAKAPLEARFRQKEDAWMKDQNRLLQEIEGLKQANREANELNRDLEAQIEAVEDECRQLRLEVRKASSSLNSAPASGDDSAWNRHVQADREASELKSKLRRAEDEIDSMRLAKVSIEKELHATKIELESLARTFDELQMEYEEVAKSSTDNREAEIKLEHLTTEHIATSAQLNAVCADLAATKARAQATFEAREVEFKKQTDQLQFEMSVLKTRAADAGCDKDASIMDPENDHDAAVLKARLEERDRKIVELEAQLLKGEEQRRQMHNLIQELRGNIRVFVRTRPFLPDDKQTNDAAISVSPDGESLSIVDSRTLSPHDFQFDKVFPPSAGQDIVFQEVADFVQSALDGYHVCLFSYGQTGSGKTHTMQGSGNGVMRGIIPRAVEQILDQAKIMQNQKWDFKLSASFLEIYNENFKDLLISMNADKSVAKYPPKLAIKRSREGKSFVEGLTDVKIETGNTDEGMKQLEALMSIAARARSVASTKMNAQSSRSHSVFMLHLHGYNSDTGAEVQGSLNLCDLAGSERLDRSGANADAKRLKETQAINKSLSCLGDVFTSLAQRASHIPFRNSKLTYLLQDCLSGDGKALMFVNLSPTTASSNESLCSLRFAQRVNQVELGKPTKNIQYTKRV